MDAPGENVAPAASGDDISPSSRLLHTKHVLEVAKPPAAYGSNAWVYASLPDGTRRGRGLEGRQFLLSAGLRVGADWCISTIASNARRSFATETPSRTSASSEACTIAESVVQITAA